MGISGTANRWARAERDADRYRDIGHEYRVYYTRQAETVYLLLAGGDKSTQAKDIKRAQGMVRGLKASGAR
jgi:putative addiction module killer protein